MKPEELRIGNYVKYKNKIVQFAIEDFTEANNNSQFMELFIEPIILTEDWLYKLANNNCIIEKLQENVFTIDRFRFIWKPEYKYWYIVDDVDGTYITKIEWVHEFQNMYYVLNGKELLITQ